MTPAGVQRHLRGRGVRASGKAAGRRRCGRSTSPRNASTAPSCRCSRPSARASRERAAATLSGLLSRDAAMRVHLDRIGQAPPTCKPRSRRRESSRSCASSRSPAMPSCVSSRVCCWRCSMASSADRAGPLRTRRRPSRRPRNAFSRSCCAASAPDFTAAWTPVSPLELELVKQETNPRLLQLGAAQDSLIVVRFTVRIRRIAAAASTGCCPSAARARPRGARLRRRQGPGAQARGLGARRLRAALQEAEVEIRAVLAPGPRSACASSCASRPATSFPSSHRRTSRCWWATCRCGAAGSASRRAATH